MAITLMKECSYGAAKKPEIHARGVKWGTTARKIKLHTLDQACASRNAHTEPLISTCPSPRCSRPPFSSPYEMTRISETSSLFDR
jgi:hypothetical protein